MISVIIPYTDNETYKKRLEITLESIMHQESVEKEIIVSETGDEKTLDLNSDIKHLLMPAETSFNPSRPKNHGAKKAEGEILYFSDADIIFKDPKYLKKLQDRIEEGKNLYLTSPKMLRFCRREFETLYSRVKKHGFRETLENIEVMDEYLATLDKKSEIEVFTKEENGVKEVQIADKEDLKRYLESDRDRNEPRYWTLNVHRGGLVVPKKYFEFVGGFSHKYGGWGCEDDDINQKLDHFWNGEYIEIPVIHQDHPRGYFVKEEWLENQKNLDKRKEKDIYEVVKNDREDYRKI